MPVEMSSLSDEEIREFSGDSTNIDTTLGTETPPEVPPTNIPKTDTNLITPETVVQNEIGGLELDEEEITSITTEAPTTDVPSLDYSKYYEMMVDKGIWSKVTDSDGKPLDTVELDEESFQELSLKQAEWKAEEELQKKEEEFGTQYNQLLDYVKNGGKVEDTSGQLWPGQAVLQAKQYEIRCKGCLLAVLVNMVQGLYLSTASLVTLSVLWEHLIC